jgi:heptosyltransferase-2
MKSILVLRGGALGDFLLTLPLLRALRNAYPAARIEIVGYAAAARLAVAANLIQAAHSQQEARWAGFYTSGTLPPALSEWLSHFDLVILGWPDPEGEAARHFPVRPGQAFLAIEPAPRGGSLWRQWLHDAAPHLSREHVESAPFMPLPLAAEAKAEARARVVLSRPYVAIHPGSGSARKNAPPKLWCETIVRLSPLPVLVVIGEADTHLLPLFRSLVSARIQLAERWELPVLGAALANAAAYAGHDTGVTHLAAAVGTTTHVIFGPTDPDVWTPCGRSVTPQRNDIQRATFDPETLAVSLRAGIDL